MKYYQSWVVCMVATMVFCATDVFACHKTNHSGNCRGLCKTTACANDLNVLAQTGNVPSQKKAIYVPYEKETGAKVAVHFRSLSEVGHTVQKAAKAGRMRWDVIDTRLRVAQNLCERKISVKIDVNSMFPVGPPGVRVSDDFGVLIGSECFIPRSVYSPVLVFRADLQNERPAQLCSIFDGSNYKGRRAVRSTPVWNLELALLCDGVAANDVYSQLAEEAGQDRAIGLFMRVAEKINWSGDTKEVVRALREGSVVMGLGSSSVLPRERHGSGLRVLAGPRVLDVRGWVIPDGLSAERRARAVDFVSFATDSSRLANLAQLSGAWPGRKTAIQLLGKDFKDDFGEPWGGGKDVVYDARFWQEHLDVINEKFRDQLGIRK